MMLDQLYSFSLSFEQALICSLILYLLGYVILRLSTSFSRPITLFVDLIPYGMLFLLPGIRYAAALLCLQIYFVGSVLAVAILTPCMGLMFGEQGTLLRVKAACFWFACSGLLLIHFQVLDRMGNSLISNDHLMIAILGLFLLGLLGSIARFLQSTIQVAFWTACIVLTLVLATDTQSLRHYVPATVRAWLGLPASMRVALLDGASEDFTLDPVHLEQYLNGHTERSGTHYSIHRVEDSIAVSEHESERYLSEEKPDLLVVSDRAMRAIASDRYRDRNEALGQYEAELGTLVEQAREVGTRVIFFVTGSPQGSDDYKKRMMHCARLFEVPYIDGQELNQRLFPEGARRMDDSILKVIQEYLGDHLMQSIHR